MYKSLAFNITHKSMGVYGGCVCVVYEMCVCVGVGVEGEGCVWRRG